MLIWGGVENNTERGREWRKGEFKLGDKIEGFITLEHTIIQRRIWYYIGYISLLRIGKSRKPQSHIITPQKCDITNHHGFDKVMGISNWKLLYDFTF